MANIAKSDPRLAKAVKGEPKGGLDFEIGSGTAQEADQLGKIWVGDGYRISSDGKALISADRQRSYRPASYKPNTPSKFNPTGVQANFIKQTSAGKVISNGHMVIK